MQYGLEFFAQRLVVEDELAHRATVQCPIVPEDALTEGLANLRQGRLPRPCDLAGNGIGVDDCRAEFGEHAGNRGLAAGNPASQADTQRYGAGLPFLGHLQKQVQVSIPDRLSP